jgi:hypothetical protein
MTSEAWIAFGSSLLGALVGGAVSLTLEIHRKELELKEKYKNALIHIEADMIRVAESAQVNMEILSEWIDAMDNGGYSLNSPHLLAHNEAALSDVINSKLLSGIVTTYLDGQLVNGNISSLTSFYTEVRGEVHRTHIASRGKDINIDVIKSDMALAKSVCGRVSKYCERHRAKCLNIIAQARIAAGSIKTSDSKALRIQKFSKVGVRREIEKIEKELRGAIISFEDKNAS